MCDRQSALATVQFFLVSNSAADCKAYGLTFGKVSSRHQMIFGYKLYLLIALNGTILDFVLTPANQFDSEVGFELPSEHHDLQVLSDKAYTSVERAAQLWDENRIQLKPCVAIIFNAAHQMIKTVNAQLSTQFHIEVNHAHAFWGLCTRLYIRLAAYTLCIYLKCLLGKPGFLQIKSLDFPI